MEKSKISSQNQKLSGFIKVIKQRSDRVLQQTAKEGGVRGREDEAERRWLGGRRSRAWLYKVSC